ncbi:protein Cbp3p, mitochondrial [Trichomonascus vanleenenianus]|uniref:Cbp3p n=1 Tax=Trichomonascus vanleenenianus TaxID=2268995 RepID=UPI003ECA9481
MFRRSISVLRGVRFNSTKADPAILAGGVLKFPKVSLKDTIVAKYTDTTPQYDVELPGWQRMLGQGVISMFSMDMDRVRSGPVSARLFRDLCKHQGYYPEDSKPDQLSKQAKFYYNTLGMPRTFQQQFLISALHIWMLFVRMRAMPRKYCREYQKKLINAIFEDIGHRLRLEVKVPSDRAINGYKKQFNDQLRGAIFSYDEGLATSDSVLAAALWRSLYASKPDIDMAHLEQLVHYIRTQLYVFEHVSDRDFAAGRVGFIDPWYRYDSLSEKDHEEIHKIAEEARKATYAEDKPSDRSVLSIEGW